MNERIIELIDIDPIEFFGPHNCNIEQVKKNFPKLKIVARGEKIRIFGDPIVIDEFERSFKKLTEYFHRYNKLDRNIIKQLFSSKKEHKSSKKSEGVIVHGVGGRLIKALTPNQKKMVDLIDDNDMLFAIGPAGTGKTYTAVALAVKSLKDKQIRKIILTRPAVESGENLGFLPGDLKEKLDPYMQPLYDALRDMIPYEKLDSYIEKGIVQIAPLAFMRGRTLDNAFVILDEAQNTTHNQMKMFLTRMGKHAKFIITGDPGQVDLPKRQISGLKEAISALKNLKGIEMIFMDEKDVIRHRLVKKIIDAYKSIEID